MRKTPVEWELQQGIGWASVLQRVERVLRAMMLDEDVGLFRGNQCLGGTTLSNDTLALFCPKPRPRQFLSETNVCECVRLPFVCAFSALVLYFCSFGLLLHASFCRLLRVSWESRLILLVPLNMGLQTLKRGSSGSPRCRTCSFVCCSTS